MSSTKFKRLKAAGWKVGTTRDFLGLSDQEAARLSVRTRATHGIEPITDCQD